jgi:tRNA A-37 threonylcarbamoyl transferase component Bud32
MGDDAPLDIQIEEHDKAFVLRLSGVVDQSFTQIYPVDKKGAVLVDLDGVHQITPEGIHHWVTVMSSLALDYLGFINVRPTLMSHFNMVTDFGGRGQVVSLYLPYRCNNCKIAFERHMDLRKDYRVAVTELPPFEKCPQCEGGAAFDDDPRSFFRFVTNGRRPLVPAVFDDEIGHLGQVDDDILTVIKDVDRNLTVLWLLGALDGQANFRRMGEGVGAEVLFLAPHLLDVVESGVEALRPILERPNGQTFFARIKPALLFALHAKLQDQMSGKIISISLDCECTQCQEEGVVEMDFENLVKLPEKGNQVDCPHCGQNAIAHVTQEIIRVAQSLTTAVPPQSVASYLRTHEKPPRSVYAGHTGTQVGMPIPGSGSQEGSISHKYEITQRIGAGGMAEIFLAKQKGPERFRKNVVLKKILSKLSANEEFVQMFLEEARIAARINHPNVVQIFELGQDGDQYTMVMEYVEGWDLNTVINVSRQQKVSIPVELACRMIADACAGLASAHNSVDDFGRVLGVVHRDVSPHNILISSEGTVKLTDFGIAKIRDTFEQENPRMFKGKADYAAPEQINQAFPVTAKSDIFAAGIILYEMVTGLHPFRRDTPVNTMKALLFDTIPAPHSLRPEAPPALSAALGHALTRDPNERMPNAQTFQTALEGAIQQTRRPATSAQVADFVWGLFSASTAVSE